jgi:uncharacterized phage protein (TIGR01671 family)
MREIKFRARRRDGALIGYNRFEAGRWQCQMLKSAGGSEEWSSGVLHGSTIEQYIGLTDKNDLEIYEGDVVKQSSPRDPKQNLFTVEWTHGGFYLNNRINSARPERLQELDLRSNPLEIIGNIYESPDLVKEAA